MTMQGSRIPWWNSVNSADLWAVDLFLRFKFRTPWGHSIRGLGSNCIAALRIHR